MGKRPWSVSLIGLLFTAVGIVGLIYHMPEFIPGAPLDYALLWVLLVRLLATIAGVFLLRGANWARWFALLWMAYHVFLSLFHTVDELVVHLVLTLVIAYMLFRPDASGYFRRVNHEPGQQ